MKNIGIFGSCQLYYTVNFFLNKKLLEDNNLNIKFCLPFFDYDNNYSGYKEELNYNIFNNLDILIIENNNLNNDASSKKIISYCKNNNLNIQIIKTCLLKFPIYPINWSGYGKNKKDYLNWTDLENINYTDKFNYLLNNMEKEIYNTDLDKSIVEFIRNNFKKVLLFRHSLHPTNILLYQLWTLILQKMNINITNYNSNSEYDLINKKEELIPTYWINPFTNKMVKDLNIQFNFVIDDEFYINKYNEDTNNEDTNKLNNS